jgi:hypothetical protein
MFLATTFDLVTEKNGCENNILTRGPGRRNLHEIAQGILVKSVGVQVEKISLWYKEITKDVVP